MVQNEEFYLGLGLSIEGVARGDYCLRARMSEVHSYCTAQTAITVHAPEQGLRS